MTIGGMFFQLCLFACCSPHPSWQCPWFPHEFQCPGCLEGPEEHPLGLVVAEQGFIVKQALFRHSLAQCPFSLQRLQVSLLLLRSFGSGLALLKALDKGMDFGLGEGRRWCLGVLGMCSKRPLTHILGFFLPSFGEVANVGIGMSFVMKVGGSSSILHKSNLLEFIFQGSLHGDRRVVIHLSPLARRKAERMLEHSWLSQTPCVVRAWQQ